MRRALCAPAVLFVFAVPAGSAAQTAIRPDKVIHAVRRQEPRRVLHVARGLPPGGSAARLHRRGPGGWRAGHPHQRREVGRHRHARLVPRLPAHRRVPVGAADVGPAEERDARQRRARARAGRRRQHRPRLQRAVDAVDRGPDHRRRRRRHHPGGRLRGRRHAADAPHHARGRARTATASPCSTRSGEAARVRERPHQLVRARRRLAGHARLPRQGRCREPRTASGRASRSIAQGDRLTIHREREGRERRLPVEPDGRGRSSSSARARRSSSAASIWSRWGSRAGTRTEVSSQNSEASSQKQKRLRCSVPSSGF